jgi:type I restriction enzyme R subunit
VDINPGPSGGNPETSEGPGAYTTGPTGSGDGESDKPRKYYVNDVEVRVLNQRVMYYGKDGKLITETLEDYTRSNIQKEYSSLHEFLRKWNASQRKTVILKELKEQGILLDELQEEIGKDLDPFDLICHVVYDMPALTRRERADKVKKRNYFANYGEQARKVLVALLDKYADEGVDNLESMDVLKVPPMNQFGSPLEIVKAFGGKAKYQQAINELEQEIYSA